MADPNHPESDPHHIDGTASADTSRPYAVSMLGLLLVGNPMRTVQ
jgi:hypothetical protein